MVYLINKRNVALILIFAAIIAICGQSFAFSTVSGAAQTMKAYETLNGGNRTNKSRITHKDKPTTINGAFSRLAEAINKNQTPAKDQIANIETALRVPRRTLAGFDKNKQSKYFMLKAWSEYFAGNNKTAQQAALRAYKTSPNSKDTGVTMASIMLLAGEKTVRVPRKKTSSRRNPNHSSASKTKGLLDQDIAKLKTALVNPKTPVKISAIKLESFGYTPGNESLCVFFGESKKGMESTAFKNLQTAASGIDNIKFLAVNTTEKPDKATAVTLASPQVTLDDIKNGDTRLKDIAAKSEDPTLLITAKDGTLKYAGPANGFLPAMVLSKITGKKIAPIQVTKSTIPTSKPNNQITSKPANPIHKPKPAAVNSTARKPTPRKPKEMDFIEENNAIHLLRKAHYHIGTGKKITGFKNAIDPCRELIRKYPNTKYSEEARMLLRQIPEHKRKQWKVTDEECGL